MRRLLLLLPLLSLSLSLAPAAPARGSENVQLSIMMDDNQLLYRNATATHASLQRMKSLGVDYVRVTVLWRIVAHRQKKRNRRRGDNPRAYPAANWDRYDSLVLAARRYGIGVYFNVTGPGPRWAMGTPPRSQRKYSDTWKPDARAFGDFVEAVGRRYSGSYRDEGRRIKLPRVSFWALYNEPNQQGWLTPQNKGNTPWAPVMYRDLWYYGRRGLDRSGHRDDIVLIGETAPLGTNNGNPASPAYPRTFISEFFCARPDGTPYRGAAARKRRCHTLDRIEPLRYSAWAHHPYTKKLPPRKRDRDPKAITMANIGDLAELLDSMPAERDGLAALNLVALTEFGYETDPPDPFSGISLAKQAEYINVGDYLAYKEPSVIANTQFLLRDGAGIRRYRKGNKRHWFNYQSGLLTAKGSPKPAAFAYRFPLVLTGRGADTASFWGWLRFLAPGVSTQVQMQFKAAGTSSFANVGDPVPVTNKAGFFEATVPRSGAGTWRAEFVNPYSGAVVRSRELKAS